MKKLLVLFVALAVASTAFAADFSFSWDTDWGWASNFDDSYTDGVDELELAVTADVDEYNAFAIQIEAGTADPGTAVFYDYFEITTDLGAYLGLSGVGISWVNGYTDPGDEEYSDVMRVGLQDSGRTVGLTQDWVTDVNLDFGMFWASVAANWDLAGAETPAYNKEMQFGVGSVDAVAGLSVELFYEMEDLLGVEENILQIDGAYVLPMDAMDLTAAGSFSQWSEADIYVYGAGLMADYMVDDMTALNASIEMQGDDDEAFRQLGGGVGLGYGDFGVDVDFGYAVAATTDVDKDGAFADGDLLGVDLSGTVDVGMVTFRLGYAVTDFGWANNANGTTGVPTEGGAYMVVTADF